MMKQRRYRISNASRDRVVAVTVLAGEGAGGCREARGEDGANWQGNATDCCAHLGKEIMFLQRDR